MDDAITLEKVDVEDVATYLTIERSVAGTKVYWAITDEEQAREDIRKNIAYFIKTHGKIVGHILYEKKSPDHIYLTSLVIMPAFQGQGIARQALVKVLEELKDIKRIDLATHPHNNKAIQLYLSLGFVIESLEENYFGDGEPRLVLARVKS